MSGKTAARAPAGAGAGAGAGADTGAKVVRVTLDRREFTADGTPGTPLLRTLFGLDALPLAAVRFEVELAGVPTSVANALRRVVIDEMPGHALVVPAEGGFDGDATTETLMLPQFVNKNIMLIPLRAQLPEFDVASLRLGLDVSNPGATLADVYAGDLEVTAGDAPPEPIFNPTAVIARIQPGKRLVIRNIRVGTGYGRAHAAFQRAHCGYAKPLDIPQRPREETHLRGGAACDDSGYEVSSLVANPQRHLVGGVVAAAARADEARTLCVDACDIVAGRLRLVVATVERGAARSAERGPAERPPSAYAEPDGAGALYTVVQLEGGLTEGILRMPGETDTIGTLLKRALHDLTPDLASANYTIDRNDDRMDFAARLNGDISAALLQAAHHCIATFGAIRNGILAAR